MTMDNSELLSALVDGELEGDALDKALLLLSTDDKAREQFQRYQRSSDSLRGYSISEQSVDLSASITAELSNDQAFEANVEKSKELKSNVTFMPQWFWQQALGMAIAASVGALAVVSVMTQQPQTAMDSIPVMASAENTNVVAVSLEQKTSNRWTVTEPEVQDRLNTYLLDHNEYAGVSDVFSNARVIAYEVE
jgi:sigma-E factor negative regulatory protein RseA